jgi:hypothetical protein
VRQAAGLVVCALVLLLNACSMHSATVKPTRATIAQIGLPVYPGARPLHDTSIDQRMGPMLIHTIGADFVTSDDANKIIAFYAARVPKNAQRMTIPMGFATSTSFQFYQGPDQKQVMIISAKGMRMISLRSVQLFQTPVPSPNHTAS